jgi:hypothetical protein
MLVAVVGKPLLPVKEKVLMPPKLIFLTVTLGGKLELVKVQLMTAPVVTLAAGIVSARPTSVVAITPLSPVQLALEST